MQHDCPSIQPESRPEQPRGQQLSRQLCWVEWNGGMERWNGTVEWNSGMEWWNDGIVG